jgi:hypothetical protein
MGHDQPGIEFAYVIKRNAGTTICVRTQKSSARSWWLQELVRFWGDGSLSLATAALRFRSARTHVVNLWRIP